LPPVIFRYKGFRFFFQDVRFSSFPRMRESSHSLKSMDTRLRGYDEFTGLAKVLSSFLTKEYRWNRFTSMFARAAPAPISGYGLKSGWPTVMVLTLPLCANWPASSRNSAI
jgi:hypothetical protein